MSVKIYLDDERQPPNKAWVWARNFSQFKEAVNKHGVPATLSIDNDLGRGRKSFECIDWLYDYCRMNGIKGPRFEIHSCNLMDRAKLQEKFKEFRSA